VQRRERARLLPVCVARHSRRIAWMAAVNLTALQAHSLCCGRTHARQRRTRGPTRARAAAQFVRRMGFQADQPMVMFRPTEVEVAAAQPDAQPARYMPATVVDRIDLFFMVKYWLRFDDGLVRRSRIGLGFLL